MSDEVTPNFIEPQQVPIDGDELRQVQSWLNSNGCRIFQEHLAALAAMAACDSINLRCEMPEDADQQTFPEKVHATDRLDRARSAWLANKMIDTARGADYSFFRVKLQPKTAIVTYDGRDLSPTEKTFGNPGA